MNSTNEATLVYENGGLNQAIVSGIVISVLVVVFHVVCGILLFVLFILRAQKKKVSVKKNIELSQSLLQQCSAYGGKNNDIQIKWLNDSAHCSTMYM